MWVSLLGSLHLDSPRGVLTDSRPRRSVVGINAAAHRLEVAKMKGSMPTRFAFSRRSLVVRPAPTSL